MKARVLTSVLAVLFVIGMNTSFVNAESTVYSNTEQVDNELTTTYFKGDSKDGNLEPLKKVVKIQNERGICVSKVTLAWDVVANNWSPAEKIDYIYDSNTLEGVKYSEWNNSKMAWKTTESMTYEYDMDGNLLNIKK